MEDQLSHEHEQGDRDEDEALSLRPGHQRHVGHGRRGALEDPDPRDPHDGHRECDGHPDREQDQESSDGDDADGGQRHSSSSSLSAAERACGFEIIRATSTRAQKPMNAMNGQNGTMSSSPVSPVRAMYGTKAQA